MHRFSRPPLHTACRLALVLACALVLAAGPALADHAMPSVIGKSEAEALRELEALGLEVRVVVVAEASPGRVSEQQPVPGARVETGDEALLRVGVRLKIRSSAPRVIGRSEELVREALSSAYDLEVIYITGPRSMEGRVMRQKPAPEENVFLRGRFVVEVVRNAVIVPVVVGRDEGSAERVLEEAGLYTLVRYVADAGAPEGIVVSQDPRSGAEILPGAVVELRVSGSRPTTPPPVLVPVPDLLGLDLSEAEAELLARGLIPHLHLDNQPGHRAWEVLSQEVPAHSRVEEGASVGLHVARPVAVADGLLMPSLYGLQRDAAVELLEHLGLVAQVSEQYSALPTGTVYRQDFEPGTRMQSGRVVSIDVAAAPPAGWSVPLVVVPDLSDLSPARAHITLLELGFLPRFGRESAPDGHVDRVFGQSPAPGLRIRAGSRVVYKLPFRARVPDLQGKTRAQALDALQAAGLQGLGRMRGPDVPGLTEVVWQEVHAGGVIARGSLVRFNFRMAPSIAVMRQVPNVVGKSMEEADLMLRTAGFRSSLRPASYGSGETMVISQIPHAGEMRPPGHEIAATYRFVVSAVPDFVLVPQVVGMTSQEAAAKLEAAGFHPRLLLLGRNTGVETEVSSQNPEAGSKRPHGATVIVSYITRVPREDAVIVPDVVGARLDKAMEQIVEAGLRASFSRVGTHVKSQQPAPGSRVKAGSSVKLKLGF